MKTSDMIVSKFLKKEEVDPPVLAYIAKVGKEDVSMEDKPSEYKFCLHFKGDIKPLVLNSTNIQMIEKIHGDETDDWLGKPIVLYNDPNIMFKGELKGGIRVRKVNPEAKLPPPPADNEQISREPGSDDAPF